VEEQVNANGAVTLQTAYVNYFGMAGLILVGIVLTAGPVVYNTVEKLQIFLVGSIFLLMTILAVLVVRPDAVAAMAAGSINLGTLPPESADLSLIALLGA